MKSHTETPSRFQETTLNVNNSKDFALGFITLCLLVTYVAFSFFSGKSQGFMPNIIMIFLGALSLALIGSYFAVKKIEISEKSITFMPAGVTISIEDDIKTVNTPAYLNMSTQVDVISRVTLISKRNRIAWVPLNILWIGDSISIRTSGFSGKELFQLLSELTNKINDMNK